MRKTATLTSTWGTLTGLQPREERPLAIRRVDHALARASEPLAGRVREARELLEHTVGDTARARHRIGEMVVEIMADEHRYGQHGVAIFATALGRSEDTLYGWARVAEAWPGVAIDSILARRTIHGVPLSISHLTLLAGVVDDEERDRFTDDALQHGLSVKALRKLVTPTRHEEVHPDDDQDEALTGRRILGRLASFAILAARRTARLTTSLENVPEDELQDPELIELLSRGVVRQRELAEGINDTVARLESQLRRLTATGKRLPRSA